jgi:hypothetical protein
MNIQKSLRQALDLGWFNLGALNAFYPDVFFAVVND